MVFFASPGRAADLSQNPDYGEHQIMKFKPIVKFARAEDRGRRDFRAGKSIEDNPFLTNRLVALSSWWAAGYNKEKQESGNDDSD